MKDSTNAKEIFYFIFQNRHNLAGAGTLSHFQCELNIVCGRIQGKGEVYVWTKWLIRLELIPVSAACSN